MKAFMAAVMVAATVATAGVASAQGPDAARINQRLNQHIARECQYHVRTMSPGSRFEAFYDTVRGTLRSFGTDRENFMFSKCADNFESGLTEYYEARGRWPDWAYR
jgi:hypothetical protein